MVAGRGSCPAREGGQGGRVSRRPLEGNAERSPQVDFGRVLRLHFWRTMNFQRRSMIVALGAAVLAFSPAGADAGSPLLEGPVKVECRIVPLRLSRGEEGRVVLTISVRAGVMINAQPPFIIEFSPCEELVFPKNFYTASDLGLEILEENGRERLSLKKPVEIPFTVNLKAKRDVHVLEGRLRYFVTSVKDGWCLKTSTKFSARFSTRLTVIQKGG